MKTTQRHSQVAAIARTPLAVAASPASVEELPLGAQLRNAARLGHHLDVLPIGMPDDRYEQEADQAAEQVVGHLESGSGTSAPVQATPTPGPAVQAKGEGGAESGGSAATLTQLPPAPGSGRPLGPAVRAPMERALGASLGSVRLHTDGQAQRLNQSLNARATTVGRDIYFDHGEYDPDSTPGRQLLAHELTHVLQQRRGGRRLQRAGRRARGDEQEQAPVNPIANDLGAQAHNQGANVHFAAGQGQLLGHEAQHVVQQAQGGGAAPAAAAGPVAHDNNVPAPDQAPPGAGAGAAQVDLDEPEQAAPYLMPADELNYNPQPDDDHFYR